MHVGTASRYYESGNLLQLIWELFGTFYDIRAVSQSKFYLTCKFTTNANYQSFRSKQNITLDLKYSM